VKRILFTAIILSVLIQPVIAAEFSIDTVPEDAEVYLKEDPNSFWKDLHTVVLDALSRLRPDITDAVQTCLRVTCVVLLGSTVLSFTAERKFPTQLVMTVAIGILLVDSGESLLQLGKNTVQKISEYGKLLLPTLTGSLAAQGAVTTSSALYIGTVLFSTVLNTAVTKLLIPLLYVFLCVCIANSALADETLKRVRVFLKWLLTWSLKTVLYLFTGYMSISGVISGTVDATALKATKLAISGAVPVIGNILSDASETIILGAGVVKNSVGAYGMLTIITFLIGPFIKVGIQYILSKCTASLCAVFAPKEITGLLDDYASVMGFILAMTGVASVLLMVGIVCMMKGVG
jgi:stage III sporulation protein AE